VKAIFWMFHLVFGCRHRQLSRVFTIDKRTYRVCFACARNSTTESDEPTLKTRSRVLLARFVDLHHQLHIFQSSSPGDFGSLFSRIHAGKVIRLADEVRGVALGVWLVDRGSSVDFRG